MKLLDYIFAARPMLLLPVWSIFLVALHYHHELAEKTFSWPDLLILSCLTILTAGAYYINQVFDIESDKLNSKLGFLQKRLVSAGILMAMYIIFSVLALSAAVFISTTLFIIFLQLLLLSFVYSAPPFRLKDRAVSGLFANAYSFGFLIPISVMPLITQHSAGLMGWDNPFYFFLSVMGVHILTTIPDIKGDKAAGKKTIGLILPLRVALLSAFMSFGGAALVAHYSNFLPLMIIAVISATLALTALVSTNLQIILAAAKIPILLLTLLAGYFYPIYFLFVVALLFLTRAYYKKRFNVVYPGLT
ncbi:MAG: UbiA family prenyltransferase [candidate division Zixibacteria bacterium]|nr:UbiA family prenyltransferase [candidate division Zixibacteria bacterium]